MIIMRIASFSPQANAESVSIVALQRPLLKQGMTR
jgi:hypothetical protein